MSSMSSFHFGSSEINKLSVIVELYDSASNIRFDKYAIILRFDSRFDSTSNHNTNLIFVFDLRFDSILDWMF